MPEDIVETEAEAEAEAGDRLAGLLHQYDEALRNEDFEAVAVLSTQIQEARGAKPLEPAPENTHADALANLYADLLPVDQALADGLHRTFHLNSGLEVYGIVTDANMSTFTVTNGQTVWTVVRSTVAAIQRYHAAAAAQPAPRTPTSTPFLAMFPQGTPAPAPL